MNAELGKALQRLPQPTAVVFTGGGGRTPAQVGMMEILIESGLQTDLLVASSFGAINAAAYAASPQHLGNSVGARLAEVWDAIGVDSAYASPGATLVRRLTVSRGKRTSQEMRDLVAAVVPDTPIADLTCRFLPIATNLATGAANEIVAGSTLEAVLASCAIPIIMTPITMDDEILFDGGFTQGAPLRPALMAGAKSIILLDTASSTVAEAQLAELRWWQVATIAYNHLIRGQIGHDLSHAASQVPILTITTDYGHLFDFSDSGATIQAGRDAADATLRQLATNTQLSPQTGSIFEPGMYGVPIGFETYPPFQALTRDLIPRPINSTPSDAAWR
jgi:NTE family protein